jgi:hypothetical protein
MKKPFLLLTLLGFITQSQAATLEHSDCMIARVNGIEALATDTELYETLFHSLWSKGYVFGASDGSQGLSLQFGSSIEPLLPHYGYLHYRFEGRGNVQDETVHKIEREVQLTDIKTGTIVFDQSKKIPVVGEVSDQEDVRAMKWALKKVPHCTQFNKRSDKNSK